MVRHIALSFDTYRKIREGAKAVVTYYIDTIQYMYMHIDLIAGPVKSQDVRTRPPLDKVGLVGPAPADLSWYPIATFVPGIPSFVARRGYVGALWGSRHLYCT